VIIEDQIEVKGTKLNYIQCQFEINSRQGEMPFLRLMCGDGRRAKGKWVQVPPEHSEYLK
jgi:hypothetical protein